MGGHVGVVNLKKISNTNFMNVKACIFLYHDQNNDIEAVEEEVVNHLEV